MDDAIDVLWKALACTNPARRPNILSILSGVYHYRYLAHRRLSDLEKAVAGYEEALETASHPGHAAGTTHRLALCLLDMYEVRKDPLDVEKTISLLRNFLESSGRGPQQEGHAHSLLALALLIRGRSLSTLKDIENSIQSQKEALRFLSHGNPSQALCYVRLGLAEYELFVLGQQRAALDHSIATFRLSLSLLSLDHTERARHMSYLARSLLTLADLENWQTAGIEGLRILQEAAEHPNSWLVDRYEAALECARIAHGRGLRSRAIAAYRLAISLLPELASFGLEDELRVQHIEKQARELPQDAAACALELDQPELAIELLEAGRAILWNSGQQLRADAAKLKEVAPHLATELMEINRALEMRPQGAEVTLSGDEIDLERRRLHRLASRRIALLDEIRSQLGFERFLLPLTFGSLQGAASHGPVVVLNASVYRCDALVIRAPQAIQVIPLSGTSRERFKHEAGALQYCLWAASKDSDGHRFLEIVLKRLLDWLWSIIGMPVCTALQDYLSTSKVPRVWWCPTGVMSFLPIHACGPSDGATPGIADMVVSSYAPTLSALLRAQVKISTTAKASKSMLVIAQPNIPERAPLPSALEEMRIVTSIFPDRGAFLVGPAATVSTVENLLPHIDWLHIISHGTQKSRNPLESALAMYDGPLKLSRLAHAHLPRAEFAFLSACHSAKGATSVPDESMHLAAGMMFAGFSSVVATSWAIADMDAPHIAREFYAYLREKAAHPVATDTAEALHMAVGFLRRAGVSAHRWVPFVHLGA